MEASAPVSAGIQPEPPEWQPRAIWVSGRLLCGSISFFFASFVFAFFYLKALNVNHAWTIGHVKPPQGLGAAVMALFLLSAVLFRLGSRRADLALYTGAVAVLMALAAIAVQFFGYTQLDFGAASGGYASVYYGWTSLYSVVALLGVYAIEIQVASLYRTRDESTQREVREGVPAHDVELQRAGVEATSFYWAFFVALGVLAWIVLYLVGP
jgi:heme/copper-type cytochrome/quinol oxidase subunit 3